MTIATVTNRSTFLQWKDITNAITTALGDETALTTSNTSTIVDAINSIITERGALSSLSTSEKATIIGAINEVDGDVGSLASLNSTVTTSIVAAINSVLSERGVLTNLTTTEQASIVGAINEVDADVGDLGSLTTTATANLVNAINEVDGDVGNLSGLDALVTSRTSLAEAVSENAVKIGDLATLTTTDQSEVVGAINEVNSAKVDAATTTYVNLEPNRGRFTNDDMTTKVSNAATNFSNSLSVFQIANLGSITAGAQFYDDNADTGGAGSSLGNDMLSLLTALDGGVTRRYGYEWTIADATVGASTTDGTITVATVDYPAVFKSDGAFLGTIGRKATVMFWIRQKTTANLILGNANTTTYVDGVLHDYNTPITSTDGWVHVRQVIDLADTDYVSLFPAIYGVNAATVQVALPARYEGEVDLGIHKGLL